MMMEASKAGQSGQLEEQSGYRFVAPHATVSEDATRSPPAPKKVKSRAGRKKSAKPAIPRRANMALVPDLLLVFQFATLAFHQQLQFVEQLRVMRTESFHEVRQRQRGRIPESADPSNCRMLSSAVTRCSSSGVWRGVLTERTTFDGAVEAVPFCKDDLRWSSPLYKPSDGSCPPRSTREQWHCPATKSSATTAARKVRA